MSLQSTARMCVAMLNRGAANSSRSNESNSASTSNGGGSSGRRRRRYPSSGNDGSELMNLRCYFGALCKLVIH